MNILTIDLEDWFHILAHDQTAHPKQWEGFESRVERNTDWILEQLSIAGYRATFFCLGWIAERHPDLIRKIAAQDHEIACHSMNHQLIFEQTIDSFEKDLIESLRLLEDISGQKIKTYRAPGFSVSESSKWVFDVLLKNGIENDCSVFPVGRNHGGFPNFTQRKPCIVSVHGKLLRELPINITSTWFGNVVFSGGGYFRLLPYPVIKSLMNKTDYVMTYFHPRDFDPMQPVISSLTMKRKMMSYVGLKGAKQKFGKLLRDFRFVSVREAVEEIEWARAPIVVFD